MVKSFCSSGARTLNSSYEGSIRSTDGAVNYTATLTADGDTLTLHMTSPESVAGLTYEFRGGELHTSLNGLDCITPCDSLPPNALPAQLYEMFSRSDEARLRSAADGVDTFSLDTRGGNMTIIAEGGVPISAESGSRKIFFDKRSGIPIPPLIHSLFCLSFSIAAFSAPALSLTTSASIRSLP